MAKRIGEANLFIEGDGMSTRFCKTKEEALVAMKQLVEHDDEELVIEKYGKVDIKIEEIKEDRYFTCKSCNVYTIGESCCFECGEHRGTVGRKTFVYYFN